MKVSRKSSHCLIRSESTDNGTINRSFVAFFRSCFLNPCLFLVCHLSQVEGRNKFHLLEVSIFSDF